MADLQAGAKEFLHRQVKPEFKKNGKSARASLCLFKLFTRTLHPLNPIGTNGTF